MIVVVAVMTKKRVKKGKVREQLDVHAKTFLEGIIISGVECVKMK
jgi:hypothetical protein